MDASLVPALEDVLMVARTGSVGQAARRLHKTPSAVSQQIRRVEERFGVKLFERAGRGVRASPSGEVAFAAIGRLFDEAEGVYDLLAGLAGKPTTTLRIATSDYLASALLVPVLRGLLSEGAPLRFAIASANSFESARLVEDGAVDFAIVARTKTAARAAKLRERTLFRQPFFWVGARAAQDERPIADRLDAGPVLRLAPGSQGRRLLDAFLEERQLRPSSTIDVSGVGPLLSYALGGVGIGLAPQLALVDVPRTRLAIERADVPALPVVLVYRDRAQKNADVEQFVERLVEQGVLAERRMIDVAERPTARRTRTRPR